MWQIVRAGGTFIFLFLCSMQDIKEKRLSVKMLVLSGALFLAMSLAFDEITWENRVANMLPGMTTCILAFLTKEQIGYGDAACLAVLGCVVSDDILWTAIMGGLLLLSLCSAVLLVWKKAERKTTLPFIPFLATGMLWQMLN